MKTTNRVKPISRAVLRGERLDEDHKQTPNKKGKINMNEQANENGEFASMLTDEMSIRVRGREAEELLYNLSSEYCVVSGKLKKLKKAIEDDPAAVSDYHKNLWKTQADYMDGYKNTLADRIKDVLNNN